METLQHAFGPLHLRTGLAFRTIGQGPALLLLHGGSGSRTHWLRCLPALSRSFEVTTLDLPGLGESATPPPGIADTDYMHWIADAIGLRFGSTPPDMVGFSFGGTTTASVAAILARRGRAPGRITLVSPSGFGTPKGRDITLEKLSRNADPHSAEVRSATARNLGKWMFSVTPDPGDPVIDLHLRNVAAARFDTRPISHRDTTIGDLREAGSAVQVLLGRGDPLIFPSLDERAARLGRELPKARVTPLDGGHWLAHESSDAVLRHLFEFHLPRSHS